MNYQNPFPGMDPYLEQPHIWPGFHNRLIAYMADDLNDRLPGHYRVDIEERTEVAAVYGSEPDPALMIPDALVMETSGRATAATAVASAAVAPPENGVAVRVTVPEEARVRWLYVQRMPDWKVVTVIEVLSPTNKASGEGRTKYLREREEIFADGISLVEIDLLRRGQPMPLETALPPSHYRILVCRGWQRPHAILYPFNAQQAIPKFTLPLRPGDEEPEVDLGALVSEVHRRARYAQITHYSEPPPEPALDEETLRWIDERLAALRRPA